MKTISQAIGNSVYAIPRGAGALPKHPRQRQVRETAHESHDDEPRAEGGDGRSLCVRHRHDDERAKRQLESTPTSLHCHCERRNDRVRNHTDGDGPEHE